MSNNLNVSSLIVARLLVGEVRLLSLVVAVRRATAGQGAVKGDLTEIVKAALRKLLAAGAVVQVDGMYSLSRAAG